MTTLVSEPVTVTPWSTMPGWGIVADLTPPELIATRGLRILRKQIVGALVVLVLLCAGGYVWASAQDSTADDRLTASVATTTGLTAQKAKYSGVTTLQNAVRNLNGQIAALMLGDVDIADFVARLHATAPSGTVLSATNITLASATPVDPTAVTTAPTTEPTIGTATLSGTSTRMVDVASYVTALQSLPGVINVVPSTNTTTRAGSRATWTITVQLTTKLYSRRFAASAGTTGGGHR